MTTDPDRVLRCALVGTGNVARLHAEAVAADPAARLVAVTDLSAEAARAFAEMHDVPAVHDDLEALLTSEHPDVVLICTPPAVHREQALAAFAAGAHVVVEKPPAPSLDELDDMRRAADAADRRLAVVFQQRTGTAAAHVKHLLDSGALGRPLIAQCQTLWFRDADYFAVPWRGRWSTEGGGTTLGHGIHQLDLLAFLLGDWASVEARMWRLDRETETEDASTATVRFAGGTVAQVVASTVSPRQTSSIRIDTQKATVTVDHLYGHGHENWAITPAPGFEHEAATWELPSREIPSGHAPLLHDVFTALRAGGPLPPTADAPARSLEIVIDLGGWWWMLTDEWRGLAVHRSADAVVWERQEGLLLDTVGPPESGLQIGRHAMALADGDDAAWIYFFSHPWWDGSEIADASDDLHRRSSVQRARLHVVDDVLVCVR